MACIRSTAARLLFLVAAAASAQPPDTPVCALFRHPEQYTGREVILTAGYRVGFEWQELVCAACPDRRRIWMEFHSDLKGGRKFGRSRNRFDALYRVRVRGVLSERGSWGHLNGYEYQFLVSEVYEAKRLWEMSRRQPGMSGEVQRSACP